MRYPQLKIKIDQAQRDAVECVARERNVSKGTLVRDAIAAATGAPNELRRQAFSEARQGVWSGYRGEASG